MEHVHRVSSLLYELSRSVILSRQSSTQLTTETQSEIRDPEIILLELHDTVINSLENTELTLVTKCDLWNTICRKALDTHGYGSYLEQWVRGSWSITSFSEYDYKYLRPRRLITQDFYDARNELYIMNQSRRSDLERLHATRPLVPAHLYMGTFHVILHPTALNRP